MSDVSDIEELLLKATKHAKRAGMIKTAIVCAGAFAGSAFGVGVASGKYLAQILDGQDRVLRLVQGQDEKIKDLQTADRLFASRLNAVEPVSDTAAKCCIHQTLRIDSLMRPR